MIIKDPLKAGSDTIAENDNVYVLEDGNKISEVFHTLPHRIKNKTETVIGATTLELDSNRDCIIVEP